MCTVDDITTEPPCPRVAAWRWNPEGEHPVFLCNFHAEPILTVVPYGPGTASWAAEGRVPVPERMAQRKRAKDVICPGCGLPHDPSLCDGTCSCCESIMEARQGTLAAP